MLDWASFVSWLNSQGLVPQGTFEYPEVKWGWVYTWGKRSPPHTTHVMSVHFVVSSFLLSNSCGKEYECFYRHIFKLYPRCVGKN